MEKRRKIVLSIVLFFVLLIGITIIGGAYIITHWVEKNVVTDIGEYEAYFGA